MSLSKHKRGQSRPSFPAHNKQDDSIIIERVRRIDGVEITRRYLKTGMLGRGGFANCYITENIETKRQAATKIVTKEELKSHRTRLRLANEIRLHKTLHHPNVVELYHCYEDKDHVYIFLQLCENQSLNQLIKTRGNFITPEIQSFLLGLVNGLQYIHSQKIIHRDLKLGNIFIDGNFRIKIGDFGLATKLEFKRECKRTVCGTPNYIAPQVLEGKGYHFEVDVWSVGVMLYTLFYGVPPFETDDANSTYQRIKQCEYQIPKAMHVPPQANNLIQKILVRNPADRPTLQDILNSDFLRLGQGILKELPAICSRRAPTKKDINSALASVGLPHTPKLSSPANSTKTIPPPVVSKHVKRYFMSHFDQVLPLTYHFKMGNNISGILEEGVQVCYRRGDGKCILRSLTSDFSEIAENKCQLRKILMSFERRFNIMDSQFDKEDTQEEAIFPKRVKRVEEGWVVQLSSGEIQCLFGENIYLLGGSKVFQIVKGREKEVSVQSVLKGERGNREHIVNIVKILKELPQGKQISEKENIC